MPTINLAILIFINLVLLLAVCREAEGDEYQGIIFSKNYALTGHSKKISEEEFADLIKSVTRYKEGSKYGTVVIFHLPVFPNIIYDCKIPGTSISCFRNLPVTNKNYYIRIENVMKVVTRLESLSSIEKLIDEGGCNNNGSVVLIPFDKPSLRFEETMLAYDGFVGKKMKEWDSQKCPTLYMFLGNRVDDCLHFINKRFDIKFCKIFDKHNFENEWFTIYPFEWVLDVSEPTPRDIHVKFLPKKSAKPDMTIAVKIIEKNGKPSYEVEAIGLGKNMFKLRRKLQWEEGYSLYTERIVGLGATDTMIMTSVQMHVYPKKVMKNTDENSDEKSDEKSEEKSDQRMPPSPSQEAELIPIALIECLIVATLFIAITFWGIIALMSISPITRFEDPTKPQVPVNVTN